MNSGLSLRALLPGICAGIAFPLPSAAATQNIWEPVNASLSQLLYEVRQLFFELLGAPSFQILLGGIALIGLLAWSWYAFADGGEKVRRKRTGARAVWRSRNLRHHGIHHYFDRRRQATA